MKKRFLSVLLCLCMVLGLVPVTVWAATGNGHTHYLCGGSTCNGSGHENESSMTTFEKEIKQEGSTLKIGDTAWAATTGSNGNTFYILPAGTYYLGSDISPNYTIRIERNVTLCLNGYKITAANGMDAIELTGGSFTLTDCKTTGEITHALSKTGRGVYVYSGIFNMYGGSITGNTATDGGGVHIIGSNSKFTMTGGSITGNKADIAGGVYVDGGSFKMTGGSITGNNADSNGGGVYVKNGKFTLTGGSITGNKAPSGDGGGVYVNQGTLTVSGDVDITENTNGGTKDSTTGQYIGGTKNNVYLPKGKTITIGTDKLSEGAKLGVTLDSNYGDNAFTSGWNDKMSGKSPADYFISDVDGKGFELSGGEVKLCDGHTHYLCGGSTCNSSGHEKETGKTTFAKEIKQKGDKLYIDGVVLTKGSDGFYHIPAGNYFLSSDIATDTRIQINANVTLCLNGHTIKRTTDNKDDEYYQGCVIVVAVNGNFTLTDCMDTGKITRDNGKAGRGVHVMGTFNMYGGSITGNSSSNSGGGLVLISYAKFNMYGGEICNNTAQYGGGVYVGKDCTFTMSGGNITGNKGDNGGGVYTDKNSTFYMYGGNIIGNNAGNNGGGVFKNGDFYILGNIQIKNNVKGGTKGSDGKYTGGTANNVYIPVYHVIGIGDTLADGATVGVTLDSNFGESAFTSGWNANMSGKTPSDYFTSDTDGYVAKLNGSELKMVSTHVHNWTYTASGDTITATCKSCRANGGEDYSGGTAKITASDATYDGNGKAATVSKTGIFENVNIAISYSKYNATSKQFESTNILPAGAGKYMASITLGDATASVEYTIGKATQTAPTGLTTKGDIKNSGTGEIQNTAENMEYNISANATTGWITCDNGSTRVAPGTYYVRYKENDNYYASDVSAALTVDAHTHSGGNATCQEKAVCDGCGQKYGELGNHNFTETVGGMYLKSAATCQSPAVYYKSCLVCDEKSSETFEYGEKDFSNHIGNTYLVGQKEATCYAEGYTGDTYCSTCNNLISSGEPIAKNAHNPASVWTTDETDHWKECQTVGCGNIIDKAAHSGGEATCVKKAICSVCKVEYGAVDSSNHKHTEVRDVKDATCCEKGYTGDTWCIDCNKIIENGSEIPATGNHTDTDGKWESDDTNHWHTCYFGTKFDLTAHNGGEATCKNKAECSECGHSYGSLDASNHKGTTYLKNQKEATCYDEGYTGDTYCSDCNEKIADGQSIAKNAHNPASVWTTDEHDHWKECQTVGCGNVIDKAAHSGGEATCVSKAVCEVCNAQYGDIDAANHKHTEIRDAKPATEQEKGYTGDTWCTDCNKKIATGSEIAMLEHKLKLVEAKDATVTEQGNIKYYYCEDCGKYFADEAGTKEISLSETVVKKLPPEIIEGNNATVNNGEKKSLKFRSNAAFTDFIRVEIDGKTLDEKDYTKAEGSIIVTLNSDFVSTLSVGEHTLGIVSESGTATAKFTVKASEIPNESPKTGDDNMVAVWSLAAILSLAVLGFTTVGSKKKRAK